MEDGTEAFEVFAGLERTAIEVRTAVEVILSNLLSNKGRLSEYGWLSESLWALWRPVGSRKVPSFATCLVG